jgi:hypothetical protein
MEIANYRRSTKQRVRPAKAIMTWVLPPHFSVRSRFCELLLERSQTIFGRATTRAFVMPNFNPELIATMRAALDDVMTHIPVEQATSGIKIRLAEFILKAAEEGQTNYDMLFAAAFSQIRAVLSILT